MRGMAELQEIRKLMNNLDDEIAKNAEDRRQIVKYLFREEEGEKARKFALQLELLEGSRARLRTRQNELRAQEKEILEKLEPTHGGSTSAPGGAGDQQAAPPPPLAAAPPQSAATWWPASWIHGVTAPLRQVLGGGKGGQQEQQQQQQLGDSAAASTIPASAGPHSASMPGTRTTALTSSSCSSSPPPSQHLSTCRQRRSHRAHPQQASAP